MRIGVLYESDEWSDHKLTAELQRAFGSHAQVQMVDMMRADAIECALSCHLLVSRVFASAQFRGHEEALRRMEELICRLEGTSTRLVNPPRAHAFEVDKRASAQALAQANIRVPRTFASGTPASLRGTPFPKEAIIKPVCGGRTTLTTLARTPEEADAFLAAAPDIPFVIQEYLTPSRGFITRIEVLAHAPAWGPPMSVIRIARRSCCGRRPVRRKRWGSSSAASMSSNGTTARSSSTRTACRTSRKTARRRSGAIFCANTLTRWPAHA